MLLFGATDHRKPISELNSSCSSTAVALKNIFERTMSQQTGKGGKGKNGKGKGGKGGKGDVTLSQGDPVRAGTCLFEHGLGIGAQVAWKKEDFKDAELAEFACSEPLAVKLSDSVMQKIKDGGALQSSLDTFVKDYTASDDRTSKRRGGRRLPDASELLAAGTEFMKQVLPNNAFTIDSDVIKNYSNASWFAVTMNDIQAWKEPENLASLRVTLVGTRTLILARVDNLLDFMKAMALPQSPSVLSLVGRVVGFFKAMTENQVRAFAAKYKLFCVTVGTGEGIYVPYGWMMAEKSGAEDVFGMCLRGLVLNDKCAMPVLSTIFQNLQEVTPPAQAIQNLFETFYKVEAAVS